MKRQLQRGGGIMNVAEGFGGGRFVGSAMGNNRTGFFSVSDLAGDVVGGVKDALKGAAKGIGDILSSDAGKLALLGLGGYGLATGSFGLPKLANILVLRTGLQSCIAVLILSHLTRRRLAKRG